ncbi:MAG: dTDP-4-dehydrorhamnose 3,5-epimerase family protein [Sphingomicrobium sp.]
MIEGAQKDGQIVTEEWQFLQSPIDGVVVREVKHVPRDHGVITEMYRSEWDPTGLPVTHSYQSRLFPGAIGAWSCHAHSIDRLFVNQGHVKLVLYDGRETSPTFGQLNEVHCGDARPMFVVLPCGVWHGLQNLGTNDALMINFPTSAYDYRDPDHYRLPWDSDKIPYHWSSGNAQPRLRADAKGNRA